MTPSWVRQLNPESYGHFANLDTKYITWCDDHKCATTFRCIRRDSFMDMALLEGTHSRAYVPDSLGYDVLYYGPSTLDKMAESEL